jgi:DNA-binding NtrC family response regulator
MAIETKRLILVESDVPMRERVCRALLRDRYEVTEARDPGDAIERMAERPYDAVVAALSDLNAAGGVAALKSSARFTPVLVLCDPDRIRSAVRALRQGADDYLLRPPDPFELRRRLSRILERRDLDSRISSFQDELAKKYGHTSFEVRSPSMRTVLDRVLRVAPMRSTVLIQGESGAGKELVARAIHFSSPRREHPFIALNCAAIPASLIESELFGHEKGSFTGALSRVRGKFEIAHRGSLFLDEIGEMDPATQAKLLRVLDEKEFMRIGGDQSIRVDVRVIAATNADLEDRVASRQFRQDLYYRLKVVTIRVPPLRERRLDIRALTATFLDQLARANAIASKEITPEAAAALERYDWPGNVRELKNVLESVLVSTPGPLIRLEDLPAHLHKPLADPATAETEPGTTLAQMERELIRRTLESVGGNRTHAAVLLDIGVRTLQRKIHLYGLRIAPRRRRRRSGEQPS